MTTAPTETIVDRLYAEFKALDEVLHSCGQPSLVVTANDCFRKALLLSAASHFEAAITASIEGFVSGVSGQNELLVQFVKRKALTRQFHTLFDWDARNANRFFSLFGEKFRRAMEELVRADVAYAAAVSAFLELGRDRNRMVHDNFGQFALEKTADEIYSLFKIATVFVDRLSSDLSRSPSGETVG